MMRLVESLRAWGTPEFEAVLKRELAQQAAHLPLQQELAVGTYVTDAPLTVLIHSVAELDDIIRVRAGIFYESQLTGCSCADDPTPVGENSEYCEVQLDMDKTTALVRLSQE